MSKLGKRLIAAAKNAREIAAGKADPATYKIHVPAEIDVAAMRRKMGLSQSEFSQRYGFPLASLKDWEQGRNNPTGPVRAYLKVIEREPKAVERALAFA
jgi:putative transcriptional regulator